MRFDLLLVIVGSLALGILIGYLYILTFRRKEPTSETGESADQLFRSMADSSPAWVSLFDSSGNIQTINGPGQELLRTTEEQIRGFNILNLFETSQSKPEIARVLENLRKGMGSTLEIDFTTSMGRNLTLGAFFHPWSSPDGSRSGFFAMFHDLSRYRRTTEALQRTLTDRLDTSTLMIANAETRYRTVVEQSPNWISLLTEKGEILSINPAGCEIFNAVENQMLGKQIWDFLPEDDRTLFKKAWETLASGQPKPFDISVTTAAGKTLFLQVTLVPVVIKETGSTEKRRVLAILNDVTERKRMEEFMRKANEELELKVKERTQDLDRANKSLAEENEARRAAQAEFLKAKEEAVAANRAKSEFLANTSHEIRTPMNAILGFTSLLLKSDLNTKQRDYAKTVNTAGTRLLQLIEDILDLSKIEAGKLSLNLSPFDISTLVEELVYLLRPKADEKRILLALETEFHTSTRLVGDQARIRQILTNLVGNAIKFTEKGTVGLQVVLERGEGRSARLKIRVADTGVGIPPQDIDRLFRKFTQVDSSSTKKFGGSGLGLAISKHLVEMMGGVIGVSSKQGEGSVFFFMIPLQLDESSPSATQDPDLGTKSGDIPIAALGGKRVLVADDDAEGRKLLAGILEEGGCLVQFAANGQEALEKCTSEQFDLVLMDLQMPVIDGIEATRLIRQSEGKGKHVPIAAVTAMAMKGDRERCLEAGMDAYLSKPYDPETILRLVLDLSTPPRN